MVRVHDEAVAIDRAAHTVITGRRSQARRPPSPTTSSFSAWELLLCARRSLVTTGVRTLRTVEDAARLARDVEVAPVTAVVVGPGSFGSRWQRTSSARGSTSTIVEAAPQVLAPLDPELAILVRDELVAHGVRVETGVTLSSVDEHTVTLADGRTLAADLVVGAIGVRPDVRLRRARQAWSLDRAVA